MQLRPLVFMLLFLIQIIKIMRAKGNIILPNKSRVNALDPVIPTGNFRWYEVTNNLKVVPINDEVLDNIYRLAIFLETVRKKLDNQPMIVTSWLRDYKSNKACGGSPKSRHLQGDAVDFCIKKVPPSHIYAVLDRDHHYGGLGLYKGHVHLDLRGSKARWCA